MNVLQRNQRLWARPECLRVAAVLERSEFGGPGDSGFGDDPGGTAAVTILAADVLAVCDLLAVHDPLGRADVEQAFIEVGRLSKDPLWRPQFADRLINMVHAAYTARPVRAAGVLTVEQRAAAEHVVTRDLGSTSMVQRMLKISFRRAIELMNELEAAGVVGPADGSRARTVLVTADELAAMVTGSPDA